MERKYIEMLEEMLQQDGVKGKTSIKKVIWLNTTQPKYKIGDYVKVTSRGHYVFNQPVRNFNAKVIKVKPIFLSGDNPSDWTFAYTLEVVAKCDDKKHTFTVYPLECDIWNQQGLTTNINILNHENYEHVEYICM